MTAEASDLQRTLRILGERKRALGATVVLGVTLFALWASRQPKIYEATVTVVVDAAPPQVLGEQVHEVVPVGPGQLYTMETYIQTQLRVLTSDSLARLVVARLKLMNDRPESRDFWLGAPPLEEETAIEQFNRAITAAPIADTEIVSVSYRHRDPSQAKRAVDGLVDAYIENNVEKRDVSNATASRQLVKEADKLRKQLSESELALYEFKRKNDLLAVALEDRINNVSRQIDKLSDALTETRLRKIARASEADELAKVDEVAALNPLNPLNPVSSTGETLSNLKTDLIQEERKLSELEARYEEVHPLVRQQLAKVRAVRTGIRREVDAQLKTAQARQAEAASEEKKISAQLEVVKQEGLLITRLEVEYNKLRRENEAISKQYALVQNRNKETELSSQIKGNNLHVLDYARQPTVPVSPHLLRAGLTSLFLSILIGVLLALLLDALDRTIKTPEDLETRLGWPFLGIIPNIDAPSRNTFSAENPSSVAAECFRTIRSKLLFADLPKQLRRLLVTSALPREGKTLATINLAIVNAQAGNRVLIVDADLRRPCVAAALGIKNEIGLTNVLLGAVSLDDAIRPTRVPNLSVLVSGTVPPNAAELIEIPRFREVLDECSARFDRVIIDSPPAVPVNDPAVLANYCDGVVLIVRAGQTDRNQAIHGRRKLIDVGARILGVALNDVDAHSIGYYGYGYGYNSDEPARPAVAHGETRS